MNNEHHRFLEHPTVEITEHEGHILCAYVKLQDRKAVRDVQPNPEVEVYFYLDEDGFPVGIKFFEPVSGLAAFQLVDSLYTGPNGSPAGVDCRIQYHFLTAEDVHRAVRGSAEAVRKFAATP